MHSNNSVPFDRIDERWYIDGLPESVTTIRFPINPIMGTINAWVPLMAGYLLLELHRGVDQTPLGNLAFNVAVPNYTRNEDFIGMLETAVEYLSMIVYTNDTPPAQVEGVMAEVAGVVVDIFSMIYTARYPYIEPHLTDNEYHGRQQILMEAENIKNDINVFINDYTRNLQTNSPRVPAGTRGGTLRNGYSPRQHQEPQPVRVTGALAFGKVKVNEPAAPVSSRVRMGVGAPIGGKPVAKQVQAQTPVRPRNAMLESLQAMAGRHENKLANGGAHTPKMQSSNLGMGKVIQPIVAPMLQEEAKEVVVFDHPDLHKDAIKINGSIYRNYTREKPYAFFYDNNAEVSVYKRTPDGNIVEDFISFNIGDVMELNYFEHELSTTFASMVKADIDSQKDQGIVNNVLVGAAMPISFEQAHEKIKATTADVGDGTPVDIAPLNAPILIADSVCATTSITEALGWAELKLATNGIDRDSFVEFKFIDDSDYVVTLAETIAIESLANFRTLVELSEMMSTLKDTIAPRWWYDFNNNLTALLNRAFKSTFPLAKKIVSSSFVDDIVELVAYTTEKHGAEVLQKFSDYMKGEIKCYFVNMKVYMLENDGDDSEVTERVVALNTDTQQQVRLSHNVKYQVSRIPLRIGDLRLALANKDETIGVVSDKLPQLHHTLSRILSRAEDDCLSRFVVTLDGIVLEVFPAPLVKDGVLLGKAFI